MLGQTYNDPFVSIQFLDRRLLRSHAFWLRLLAGCWAFPTVRGDARCTVAPLRHCSTSSQRWILVCHLIRVDLSKTLSNSFSLVQLAEYSVETRSCARSRGWWRWWSVVKLYRWRRRSWGRRWWWRRSCRSFWMRGRWCWLVLFHGLNRLVRR